MTLASHLAAALAAPLTLDAAGLSKILGRACATIRADISRRPHTLPPMIRMGRRTVWLQDSVIEWLKAQERPTPPAPPAPAVELPKRRRGRPTKAEQLARQRAAAAGGGQ